MSSPLYPSLYQINTRVLLNEISRAEGQPVTLANFPEARLEHIAQCGLDWVWLMGVWQTGPAGRQVSLKHAGWMKEYRELLPDFTESDVDGSPYAIRAYSVAEKFGGDEGLAHFRERLAKRHIKLLLDFVPNHTSLDHPWAYEHPEFYIHGTEQEHARAPQNYVTLKTARGPILFAHGRDPYFDGWPDTLQLNYRHAGLRQAQIANLSKIAQQCDGVRCDMAMLLMPEVIARTWGNSSQPTNGSRTQDGPFWIDAIPRVRQQRPDFLFVAEVYWNMEWELQQQGFDYTYDKRLYDRLRDQDARQVKGHLWADWDYQRKLLRFLENHDEPRAAEVFPLQAHQAAAVITYFVPGMRFFHEGQLEGRRWRTSNHLQRRPEEISHPVLPGFYRKLLDCLKRPEVRGGIWQFLECREAWQGNATWEKFLAFAWSAGGARLLAIVNFGPNQGQSYVKLPFQDLRERQFLLRDLMSSVRYERDGSDLANRGLYVDLPPWGFNVFTVEER